MKFETIRIDKCCNILQYFGSDCNRLQSCVKYCNILQDFLSHLDSNGFESWKCCNILQYFTCDCNRLQSPQKIAIYCNILIIRIHSNRYNRNLHHITKMFRLTFWKTLNDWSTQYWANLVSVSKELEKTNFKAIWNGNYCDAWNSLPSLQCKKWRIFKMRKIELHLR